MNPNLIAPNQPRRKQLPNVHYFNDTNREVYTPFGRGHGMLQTLFDPQSRLRCIIAALVEGHGIKRVSGDTFKTLADFVLKKEGALDTFRAELAFDSFVFFHYPQLISVSRSPHLNPFARFLNWQHNSVTVIKPLVGEFR
tara:strand:+ start:1229 stop:1648 length:420 start_codon:yes stop_codon:yes gene_type:complete